MVADGSLELMPAGPDGLGHTVTTEYYKPSGSMPVAINLNAKAIWRTASNNGRPFLIADWAMAAANGGSATPNQTATTPVDMTAVTAAFTGSFNAAMTNTDTAANANNFHFRHGRDESIMNALFADGHVASFTTTKANLTAVHPSGGDLTCANIFLDAP